VFKRRQMHNDERTRCKDTHDLYSRPPRVFAPISCLALKLVMARYSQLDALLVANAPGARSRGLHSDAIGRMARTLICMVLQGGVVCTAQMCGARSAAETTRLVNLLKLLFSCPS
jgi:hypothetical protein